METTNNNNERIKYDPNLRPRFKKPQLSIQELAMYLGQGCMYDLQGEDKTDTFCGTLNAKELSIIEENYEKIENLKLMLKPLSALTFEENVEIASIAFGGRKDIQWHLTKVDKTGHWLLGVDNVDIEYFFRLNSSGEIYSRTTFYAEKEGEETTSHDNNIGKIHYTEVRGVPYLMVTKYLISKGYDVFRYLKTGHAFLN